MSVAPGDSRPMHCAAVAFGVVLRYYQLVIFTRPAPGMDVLLSHLSLDGFVLIWISDEVVVL